MLLDVCPILLIATYLVHISDGLRPFMRMQCAEYENHSDDINTVGLHFRRQAVRGQIPYCSLDGSYGRFEVQRIRLDALCESIPRLYEVVSGICMKLT